MIAAALGPAPAVWDLGLTLLAGAAVNLFIVGLNQVEDVEIDRINKPHLPIAAGDLSPTAARRIVGVCAALPLAMGLTQGPVETLAVLAALAIGAAYSSPPLRLKRFPAVAAASISIVRAVVVNLAVYWHFAGAIDPPVWALTAFVLPFSFAIAVLKDVPDAEGDRRFRIATFTVRLGPRRALAIGMAALTVGYGGMAVLGPIALTGANPWVLAGGHVGALAILWRLASRVDVTDRPAFTGFYMSVWALFFCEYALVPAAVLAG